MQISPIPTLSEEINDIRLRTADIVANRIIPNEATIYAGGDKSKKLRKEINISKIRKYILKQKKLLTFIMFIQFAKRLLVQILVLAGRKNMQLL